MAAFKMFGAMHFIYYTNRSMVTKVYSPYLSYIDQQHMRICLVASDGRKPVTFRSLVRSLAAAPHIDICFEKMIY